MPVKTQKDAALKLMLDGTLVECQVIDAAYTMAAPGESTPVPVACGDVVAEPGEPQNGEITGTVFKDTSATGITRMLATAALSGAEMEYEYVEADGTPEEFFWSGRCTVPAFAIDFAPDKLGRHALALTVTTSVLADPFPTP